ncbi:VacJ family lipoprotein [Rhodospirillaceae bacterium AH-315-P19]|nr:VacJ family lipoprotein [Rhodospirillaceae bacterium AH-315-P19]
MREGRSPFLLFRMRRVRIVALFLLLGMFALPLSNAHAQEKNATNDPIEYVNRGILDFNLLIDRFFLKPVAQGYRFLFPAQVRKGIHNALRNLQTPTVLANDLLQGKFERAATTVGRFAVNSTIGIGGIFDVAVDWGMEPHVEDFGQTLAVWGVPDGPYLMLPVVGPSNPRDLVGGLVDSFADPFRLWANHEDKEWITYARSGLSGIDRRERNIERFDDLQRTSIDLYATIRSLYRQDRLDKIHDGKLPMDSESSPFGYSYPDYGNGN